MTTARRAGVVLPDDDVLFRLAQLLLLLRAVDRAEASAPDLERLAYLDFFAANPFLIVADDDADADGLRLAGFDRRALSYGSPGQRFTSRRERLQHDLGLLVAYGLVVPAAAGGTVRYTLTDLGRDRAEAFTAMYARAYTASADLVIRRLRPLSPGRLRRYAARWLDAQAPDRPAAALLDVLA